MKKKTLASAKLVYDNLCLKTNAELPCGAPIRADYLVAIDDDATSALAAVQIYYLIRKKYGYCPRIICVGGKGLMSRYSHDKSEAELLAHVCRQLGVPDINIIILGEGRNTGDNVLAVADFIESNDKDGKVIWAVTKRLSLRLERTQAKQAPQVKSWYYVIPETLENACKWLNGKRLGNSTMMAHELASILNRCEAYAGIFQEPIPFEISAEVREAAKYLEKRYRLKLPTNLFQKPRALAQFAYLFLCLKWHKKKIKAELDKEIVELAEFLYDSEWASGSEMPCYKPE